ncbi:unnamed protein product [Allacma fusca]|uniref:Uncharacterized protein n=1 Tax=Allacma fusca TaxID=39272 RepID=A0A8J2JYJ9_9HEXA|nr:unnamed protein product [Allacma fusca]
MLTSQPLRSYYTLILSRSKHSLQNFARGLSVSVNTKKNNRRVRNCLLRTEEYFRQNECKTTGGNVRIANSVTEEGSEEKKNLRVFINFPDVRIYLISLRRKKNRRFDTICTKTAETEEKLLLRKNLPGGEDSIGSCIFT